MLPTAAKVVRHNVTFCRGAFDTIAVASCISFGGTRIDRAIAQEVLNRLQPLGVEAALAALETQGQDR
jgi:hypothetical protein